MQCCFVVVVVVVVVFVLFFSGGGFMELSTICGDQLKTCSNNDMWHLSVAENPQPPGLGDGGYGSFGATSAPSEHGSRSTEHGTGSSRRSDPNEMNGSGAELPQEKESDVNSI